MEKKKIAAGLAAAMLIGGGVFAYFQDTAVKTNTITIGGVDIELKEEKWDEEEPLGGHEDLVPNQSVNKDPKVTNTGKSDAYVYLEVSIPKANIAIVDDAGNKLPAASRELFSYTANTGWTLLKTVDGENSVTYVYGYNDVLAAGQSTNTLFDTVTLANITEDTTLDRNQEIPVTAKAIQAEGTGTMQEAYAKIK